jgi:hypothetical protein
MWRSILLDQVGLLTFLMHDKTDITSVMFHLWIVQALFGGDGLIAVHDEGVKSCGVDGLATAHKKG